MSCLNVFFVLICMRPISNNQGKVSIPDSMILNVLTPVSISRVYILTRSNPSFNIIVQHFLHSASLPTPAEKRYWCYYRHWSKDLVSPVCGIFGAFYQVKSIFDSKVMQILCLLFSLEKRKKYYSLYFSFNVLFFLLATLR